jgi:hypothetical protein
MMLEDFHRSVGEGDKRNSHLHGSTALSQISEFALRRSSNQQAVPFVIWCNQRSGSTHLSSLLASHPEIACWRELFFAGEGRSSQDYFTRSRSSDLPSFLDRFFLYDWRAINLFYERPMVQEPNAVGFKLKYQQVARYPRISDYLLSRRSTIRVIHLVRANLLATLVSSRILPLVFARFNDANVLADTSLNDFHPLVSLDAKALHSDLECLEAEIVRSRELVANFNTLEVTYEDIVGTPPSSNNRLLTFLSVNSQRLLNSRYRKLLPMSPLDSISNKDEVWSVLKGTRFESCLSDWS